MNYAVRQDSIWKAIKYVNDYSNQRQLKINDIQIGYNEGGLFYLTGKNITYNSYDVPPGCPYTGKFRFDIRCRFYYQPTLKNISIAIFDPQIIYNDITPQLASTFCQRRLKYLDKNISNEGEIFSLLCIILDVSQVSDYVSIFGTNSIAKIVLDPRKLTIVYDSQSKISNLELTTLYQTEIGFLQNKEESQTLLQNINQMSQFILDSQDSIRELKINLNQTQKAYQYNRNGTECIVLQNLISVIDKVPKQETLKKMNPSKKFQLKSVFIYLDIVSKQKMTQYSQDLKNSIQNASQVIIYCSLSLLIVLVSFQFYCSIILGQQILYPIIHLTGVLKQIKIVNQNDKKPYLSKKLITQSLDSQKQNQDTNNHESEENQIQIDFDINCNFEGVCFSQDTQELLYIFQNMFQILLSINKNFFNQDESTKLLNLNQQIKHFENVKNYSSLGVCFNNIGVIHYNNHRYLESVKNFQKSIIYANYELNVYSHNNSKYVRRENGQTENQKMYSKINTYFQYLNCQQEIKDTHNLQEIQQLYQNLFNRKFNLLKALFPYLQKQPGMWDIFQEKASELLYLNQEFLGPSQKREILTFYTMLKGFFNSNEFSSAGDILNIISDLYSKKYEKQQQENKKYEQMVDQDSKDSKQRYDQVLMSPLIKHKKQNHKKNNNQKTQNIQNDSHIQANDQSILFQEFIKQEKSKDIQQNVTLREHFLETQNNSIRNSLHLENKQKNTIKSNDINLSSLENSSLNIDFYIMKHKTSSMFKKNNERYNFQREGNKSSLETNQFEILHQKLVKSYQNKYFMGNKNNNNSFQKPQNSEKIKIVRNQKAEKQIISTFYQLRKTLKNQKIQEYKFSSDVLFQYYAQSQAEYQIYLNNQYNAAKILTNCFEKCRYYLPHLKLLSLNKLHSIFSQNKIKNESLEEMKTSYQQLLDCNYHVYVISACFKKRNKKCTYQICSDLYNDILYKQEDVFGLVQYQHKDHIFEQVISQTFLKTLKSNIKMVDQIVEQLYKQKNKPQYNSPQKCKNMPSIQNNMIQTSLEQEQFQQKQQIINSYTQNKSLMDINVKQTNQIQQGEIKQNILEGLNSSTKRQNSYEDSKTQENKTSSNVKKLQNIQNKDFEIPNQNINSPSYQQNDDSLDYDIQQTNTNFINKQSKKVFNFHKNSESINAPKQNYIKEYLQNKFNEKKQFHILFDEFQTQILEQQNNKFQDDFYIQQNKTSQITDSQIFQTHSYNNNNLNENKCNKMKDDAPFNNNQTTQFQREQIRLRKNINCNLSITCNSKKENDPITNNIKNSTEFRFHQGIQAALKQFILNTNTKINYYLELNAFKNQNKTKQFKMSKSIQKFIIYTTDDELQFNNNNLLKQLCLLLHNLEIQLLVLSKNHSQSLEEFSDLQDIQIEGKQIILFFKDEQMLLLYIYNFREHVRNNFYPMMIEYF